MRKPHTISPNLNERCRGHASFALFHSAKPDGSYDLIERASPGPYLELFARRQRFGWDSWGDEARNDVSLFATEGAAS